MNLVGNEIVGQEIVENCFRCTVDNMAVFADGLFAGFLCVRFEAAFANELIPCLKKNQGRSDNFRFGLAHHGNSLVR